MPDNDARRQAEDQIKRLAKDPQVVPALFQHLRTAQTPNVRQLAAVLLRKRITGHWAKLSPQLKQHVKQSLIESITVENSPPVRRASANVVSVVAKYAVPAGEWPDLLTFLFQCSQSAQEDHRQELWDSMALDTLKPASDPAANADLAIVLMQEGLAQIFLVGRRELGLLEVSELSFLYPAKGFFTRFLIDVTEGDTVEAVVPHMGESITDGTLANFLKKPGERVEADEAIAQIETDKVTIDIASPASGVIQEFLVKEGDTVEPGTKVAIISKSDAVSHAAPSQKEPVTSEPKPSPPAEDKHKPKVESSPVAEKPKAPSSPPPPKQSAKEPQLPPKERERRVPMTRLRKRVATRLKDSQNTFALLTTFNEVDMTNLMKLRSQYKDAFYEKHGVKLGLMSGFIKAAVSALQHQPVVNAVIDGDDIIYRDYVDISIAVGTSKGLVVPVIRNADKMNFAEIEKTINTLAKKANEGTISIDEMAGGSFTVSNGGVYGSLISTPIINPPQSAILGMHSIVSRPMVVGGSVEPRPMMYVALTYDHRLIDGREAVYFLRRVKDVVEDPQRLLLDI